MTVGELIKQLQEFDPAVLVTVPGTGPNEGTKKIAERLARAAVVQPASGADHCTNPGPKAAGQTLLIVAHLS